MKRPDHWVVLNRRNRGHVQDAPDVGAAANDHPASPEGAVIAGGRSQAGEGGNPAAIQVAEFRQIRR
jgi:hypothetical protein